MARIKDNPREPLVYTNARHSVLVAFPVHGRLPLSALHQKSSYDYVTIHVDGWTNEYVILS